MKEYIEKADAINLLWLFADESCASVVSDFEGLPAADVAEVRHGRWIFEPGKIPYCSECKEYSDDGDKGATFCPWCGARMNKEADHD